MRALLLIAVAACGSKKQGAPCDLPGGRVCVGENVVACSADRELGDTIQTCPGLCNHGACPDSCGLKDVELVYTVDRDNTLSSFDPSKPIDEAFRKIGKLTCDPKDHPFSMAIDRNGIAWVLYNNGDLYKVSIVDAHCSSKPALELGDTFGMGFVSDGPKSPAEKLFMIDYNGGHPLDLIDTTAAHLSLQRATGKLQLEVQQNPELTGTGDGKLYGYFPEHGRGFVQEIDRHTARVLGDRLDLDTPQGTVSAWAFAHWGGTFYVFVTIDGHSNLYAVPRKGGPSKLLREDLPSAVTGAGVSTCAPLLEKS